MYLQMEHILKMETRTKWQFCHNFPVLGSMPQLGAGCIEARMHLRVLLACRGGGM